MKSAASVALGLVLLLGASTPERASAQSQNRHWLVCGGNWFNTCASVDVTVGGLVTDAATRAVTLRVLNLSGMNGTRRASVFTKIGFFNIGGPAAALGPLAMSGDLIAGDSDWRADGLGAPPGQWILTNGSYAGGIELDLTTLSGPSTFGVRNGIANQCSPGELPAADAFWWNDCYTTAGSIDFADYTEIRFNVSGLWDLAGTDLLIRAGNGPKGLRTECITGVGGNCGDPMTVVPEPVSMILLGTGLAGLGVASYARRRRDDELEDEATA